MAHKKKKAYLLLKTVRTTKGCLTPEDLLLSTKISQDQLDFLPEISEPIFSTNFPFLLGETPVHIEGNLAFELITLEASHSLLDIPFHPDPKFKERVTTLLQQGWKHSNLKENKDYIAYQTHKRQEKAKAAKAKGYIHWRTHLQEKTPIKETQGGFSDQVFEEDAFQEYVSQETYFGWLGDKERTASLDRALEKVLQHLEASPKEIATWITSTHSRHILQQFTKLPTPQTQLQFLQQNAPEIYNNAIIYCHPQHQKTLKSSLEIKEKLQKKGLLFS